MLDLNFVRANLADVEAKLGLRGAEAAGLLRNFLPIDGDRREAITKLETLKAERNRLSSEIQSLRKSGGDAAAATEQVRQLKAESEALETTAAAAEERLRELMQTLPNLPMDSVPEGKSEHDNVVVKTVGEPTTFDFAPRPHWEIGESLGILDFERAAKVSGSRFTIHFAQGARLERALANFMLDLHTRKHGYTEVLPPTMVNSRSLFGTSQLPKFAEDLFHCDDKGMPTRPAITRTTTTGLSRRRKSRSPTSFAMRRSRMPCCRSASARIRRAFGPRREAMARTFAGLSGSTSFRRWNW